MTFRVMKCARLAWPQAASQTYEQHLGCRFNPLHQSRSLSGTAPGQPKADVVNVTSSQTAATAAAEAEANVGAAAAFQQAAVACSSTAGKVCAPAAHTGLPSYINPALLAEISGAINRLTGYESIEQLKSTVVEADRQLQENKKSLQAAKEEYDIQLSRQTQLHREVTALLQRKSSWVPADVARFTELYAAEHQTEQAVAAAKASYSSFSRDVEQLQLHLMNLIRERYQQEQLWSDKIRRASTWWTWGLMGLHFASFIAVYTVLEPRKRRALQDAVASMLQGHQAAIDNRLVQLQLTPAATRNAASDELAEPSDDGKMIGQLVDPSKSVQQQQQQDEINQQLLHGVQKLQQQLQQIAAAAVEGQQQQQQQQQWQWVPGISWATKQVAAAREHGKAAWQRTRRALQASPEVDNTQDPAGSISTNSDRTAGIAAHQEHNPTKQKQQCNHPQVDTSSTASLQRQAAVQHESRAVPAADLQSGQQLTPSTAPGEAPTGGLGALLQKIHKGDSVLQVTRNQLAAVGAIGAGAGVAAGLLVVVLFSAFGGKGASA